MQASLKALLRELETFGRQHDSSVAERTGRMLNITPDTGEFLAVLTRSMGPASSKSAPRTAIRRCGWPTPPAQAAR